eukprot:SAG11_NODE_777_length_7218_cov_24.269420_5_plen_86_part_00
MGRVALGDHGVAGRDGGREIAAGRAVERVGEVVGSEDADLPAAGRRGGSGLDGRRAARKVRAQDTGREYRPCGVSAGGTARRRRR